MLVGNDRGTWYHENFLREDRTKLKLIKRVAIKRTSKEDKFVLTLNAYYNPPNFYEKSGLSQPSNDKHKESLRSDSTVPAADALLVTGEIDSIVESRTNQNVSDDLEGLDDFSSGYNIFSRQIAKESESSYPVTLTQGMQIDTVEPVPQGSRCPVRPFQFASDDIAIMASTAQAILEKEMQRSAQFQIQGDLDVLNEEMIFELDQLDQFDTASLHNVFSRPIGKQHAGAFVPASSQNIHMEVSIPPEVRRRDAVPCLAAIQRCDGMQSLGINGHPQVEFDNMDVTDEEFKIFSSQFWP